MKTITAIMAAVALSSCAQTVIYRNGAAIARFQGDITGLDYQEGDTVLRASTIDHSSATKAQGDAAAGKITAAGAAIGGAGITSLLK